MSPCTQPLSAVVQWVILPTIHSERLGSKTCQLERQDPPSPSGRLCRVPPASFTGMYTTCAVSSKARGEIWTGWRGGLYHARNCRKTGRNQTEPRPASPPPHPDPRHSCSFVILENQKDQLPLLSPFHPCSLSYFLSGLIQPQSWISLGLQPVFGMRKGKRGGACW